MKISLLFREELSINWVKFTVELDAEKLPQEKKRTLELNLKIIETQIAEVFTNYFETQAKNSSTGLCRVVDIEVPCSGIVVNSITGEFDNILVPLNVSR